MTPLEIMNQVRYVTKTSVGDGVGAEADLLRILNDYYLRMATELISLNDGKFGTKATTTLCINPNQEDYALPSDLVRLKRVEVSYDGSSWKDVDLVDDSDVLGFALDPTTINQRFTTSDPKAAVWDDMLYLRPIPSQNVTNGLRIWYSRRPTLLSNATASVFVPSEYQGYLVYGVASEVALRQGEFDLQQAMLARWEDGLSKMRRTFAPRAPGVDIDFKNRETNYD